MIQRHNNSLGLDGSTRRQHSQWKRKVRFGTWNIKTLVGKEVELIEEMKSHKLEVLGLSEVKKKGSGIMSLQEGYTLRFSGVGMDTRAKEGVAIVTSEQMEMRVSGWEPVNSRIIVINLDVEVKISLIQTYAPTEDSNALDKEEYYVQLQRTIGKEAVNGRHVLIGGDFNGRIGQDKKIAHGSMGNYGGEKTLNENGRRLIEFCINNQLLLGNSFFPHKVVHKITFQAEGRNARSIIDYFIYPQNMRNNIMDVKVIRGAELTTDHRLLVIDTRFKKPPRPKTKRFEVIRLKELLKEEKRIQYAKLVKERMQVRRKDSKEEINEMWNELKSVILKSAEEVCGKAVVNTSKTRKRTRWWNEEVKEKVKDKKVAWKRYIEYQTEGNI